MRIIIEQDLPIAQIAVLVAEKLNTAKEWRMIGHASPEYLQVLEDHEWEFKDCKEVVRLFLDGELYSIGDIIEHCADAIAQKYLRVEFENVEFKPEF